jgi:hypothetical protein
MKRKISLNIVQVLSQVFTIITQFAGSSSIVLAIICKDLVKYAYHLHPSFDDLWFIRCSDSPSELTPMKVLSFLEWGPWGIGTFVEHSDDVIFSLTFLDVVFEIEFRFHYARKFILTVTCPNFVNDNNNDSDEDTESDDEYMLLSTVMLIPLTVPKHKIRKTLFPCFRSLYREIKKSCLSFLNRNPQCLVSTNIQDAPVVRKMNADSWLKVAERWQKFNDVEYWEENPKDVFYYK